MHKVKSNGTVKLLLEVGETLLLVEDLIKIEAGFQRDGDDLFFRFYAKNGIQRKLTFSYKNGIYFYDSETGKTKSIPWAN